MKKLLLNFIFLLITSITVSQTVVPTYYINQLNYNGTIEPRTSRLYGSNNFPTNVRAFVMFSGDVLDYIQSETFNDVYYKIEISLRGKNNPNSGDYTTINTKIVSPNDFVESSGKKIYYGDYFDLPGVTYKVYTSSIRILEYRFNNDFTFGRYILSAKYYTNSERAELEPSCWEQYQDGTGSEYDLQLLESDTFVSSICCSSVLSSLNPGFLGGTFPVNYHRMTFEGSALNLQLNIKNRGFISSSPAKLKFYLSKDYNSKEGIPAGDETIDIPSIARNGEFVTNPSLVASDFLPESGFYYLVIDIETNGEDGNPNNNYVSIPVVVNSENDNRNQIKLDLGYSLLNVDYFSSSKTTDDLKIYKLSLNNSLVLHKQVSNSSITSINNLPEGTYIVHINDQYIKKFKKLGEISIYPTPLPGSNDDLINQQ